MGFKIGAMALACAMPALGAQSKAGDVGESASPTIAWFGGLGGHGRKVGAGSADAQRAFDQGLAFLFAFNHEEARRSFELAARLDPTCAMAWWGAAMSYGPHINNPAMTEADARSAAEAIARARASLVPSKSDADRALIEAAVLRYPPEGGAADRGPCDAAYAAAMKRAWEANPGDADVGALLAEALMDLRPWDLWTARREPQPGTPEILGLLDRVMEIDANHPLALHLAIHAHEGSPEPWRAAPAADRLRFLQPGLAHMVHMPSHIDVRLGRWASAADANDRAIRADAAYRARRPPEPGFYRLYMLHNHHMLTYAAMMRGQSDRARKASEGMMAALPIGWARDHAAIADGIFALPMEVAMRFGRWDEILAAPEPEAAFPLSRALRLAFRGVALAARGKPGSARREQAAFLEAKKRVPPESRFGNNASADILAVAEHLLEGEIAYREGDDTHAFASLRKAVEAEDALRYDEPADWIQPVRHALGAALSQSGRWAEAEAVYREDLERCPENGWSLFGLAECLKARGLAAEEKAVRERFERAWADADVVLRSSCFCQPGPGARAEQDGGN
ncbi:MAG: hypothetical protein U0800_01115 [Isosphaeraceae bacterium]